MNDFTKEELSLMFISVPPVEATKELKNKLQSMIDNYCEHKWVSGCGSHDCHSSCVVCDICDQSLTGDKTKINASRENFIDVCFTPLSYGELVYKIQKECGVIKDDNQ